MKFLRIVHIVPISFLITILFFTYRYVWFSVETIPVERVIVAIVALFLSLVMSTFVELNNKPNSI